MAPKAPDISKALLKLARQIDASWLPDNVAVEPGDECFPGRCFDNVAGMVRRSGGTMLTGWSLREVPTVFVEGTFHAVWRGPDGRVVDVTPHEDGRTSILFQPDSKTRWQGDEIEPRRMMLHEQACYCGSGMPFKICHGLADE